MSVDIKTFYFSFKSLHFTDILYSKSLLGLNQQALKCTSAQSGNPMLTGSFRARVI